VSSIHSRRRQRAADISRRVCSADDAYPTCAVFGCGRPTRAAAGRGLNRLYCRRHEDHFQRHGSYHKGSYSAAELRPYRLAAERWLKTNSQDPYARAALQAVGALMRSGRAEEAFRLRGLPPAERARVAWGRLRRAGVPAAQPVAAWLAVEMRLADDPQPDRRPDFKRVQAAKLVHRMASGTHRRWEQERPDGGVRVVEMHKYPASRGRVLRHIGEALEQAVELLAAHRVSAIRAAIRLPAPAPPRAG
jgi:hypothetical protein